MDERPLPGIEDDRVEPLRPVAPAMEVGAVRPRHRVPRWALAAGVVGLAAFMAGLALATPQPREPDPARPAVASASPGPEGARVTRDLGGPAADAPAAGGRAPDATAGGALGPDGSPRPTPRAPGSSRFLATFDPVAVVTSLPGGAACTSAGPLRKEVPRTRADGPRLTVQRAWMLWCPVPEARRQAFVLDVLEGLVDVIPADTFGYAAGGTGTGDGLFPYAERPLAGTVAVAAGSAGDGQAIAIVVEEWRLDREP